MGEKEIKGVTLPKGTVLKNAYVIERVIGSGGFGITYLVSRMDNGKKYAVKELFVNGIFNRNPDCLTVTADEDKLHIYDHSIKRFMEEAEIIKALNHEKNVVKITDYFYENNTAYYVMEYLDGITVKQYMRENEKFDFQIACEIVLKTGEALSRIHEKYSYFHRDISPENIILVKNKEPVLLDFGTAKSYIRDKNQIHSIVLKPGFAPPEQYTGKNQGPWTDVYSLAGTFYYMATGIKIPTAPDRLMDKTYEPLFHLVPECSEQLSKAVDRALILDEKKRTGSMKSFLQAFKAQPNIKGHPVLVINDEVWRIPPGVMLIVGRNGGMNNIGAGDEKRISSQHMLVAYNETDGTFFITDISTTGVFLEGKRLSKEVQYNVPSDTVLILGDELCRIRLEVS